MDLRGTYKGGGGPDKTILSSAQHHDKERVFVLVTYLRDPGDQEFQITEKARKLGIPYVEVQDGRLLDIKCLKKLNGIISEYKIDLIHAHDEKSLLYGWFLKRVRPRLKIVFTCHAFPCFSSSDFRSRVKYYDYSIRKQVILWLIRQHLKPIMVVSEATKKKIMDAGLKTETLVLYNGIDADLWRRQDGNSILRIELGLKQNDFLIGTVARIDRDKDLPTFFKIVNLVTAQVPNVRFAVVGDGKGDELVKAKHQAEQLGLKDSIYFTGHRSDLLDAYSSLDIFLMTSVTEGLPNTILEAMAMKVPVVSTSVGGVPELIVDGEHGFLCSVGDAEALSRKVIELIQRPGLRVKFAENARKRVEEDFSFDKRVRRLENLYEYYASID
jgi:glycosyltransferase involved in cell wall biosynthesis